MWADDQPPKYAIEFLKIQIFSGKLPIIFNVNDLLCWSGSLNYNTQKVPKSFCSFQGYQFFFSSSSNLGLMPGIIWTMLLSVVQITGHSFIFWQLDCIARKKMSQKRNDWQRRFDRKKWCRLIYLRFIKMWRYVDVRNKGDWSHRNFITILLHFT